ncbi:MAG: amino acid adenylation domain-containing protein [Rickettsiales bacterium]
MLKITNIDPTAEIYKFLTGGKEVASLTRAQLLNRALHIASELQKHSVKGERVLLLLPSSLEYATSFMGCILAGAIAVPAYTPSKRRNGDRIKNIYNDCKPKIIISLSKFSLTSVELMGNDDVNILSLCQIINIDKIENNTTSNYQEVEICENDIAFLQYTSGSTAKPKGVMVTHKNLIHNIKLLAKIYNLNSKDITVSWLPIYHDMGLIIGILKSIYLGDRSILMATEDFIKSPLIWLKTISKYRATCSAAPNFAYNLCLLKKISSQDAQTLDLSSWQTALNAAEPIQPQILLEFTNKFSQYGYKQTTNTPSYGMAEATLFISACGYGKKETITYFDKHLLEYEQKAVKAKKSDKAKPLVSCGKAELMAKLLIVNPDTLTKCSEGQVGEIWVKDTSVAQGYWQKPEVTNNIFHAFEKSTNEGPFLRSGDLGFFYEEELYIASRKKDILIINGQNIYPQDIELLVEKSDIRIRKNTAAAFTIEMHGTERIVIIQEGNFTDIIAKELFSKITTNIRNEYQLAPYDIVFIKKGTFNKTSSGKIQRQLSRKLYLEDRLEIIASLQSLIKKNRAKSQYPKTTLEKYLAKLWQENLTLEPNYQICLSDNFFYLGGNSIKASSVLTAINAKLNIEITLREYFKHANLAELALIVAKKTEKPATKISIKNSKIIPASTNQQDLWFSDQNYNIQNNIRVKLTLSSKLNINILTKSLINIITRHDLLRAAIIQRKNQIIQKNYKKITLPLEKYEVKNTIEINKIIRQDLQNSFSLDQPPLFRLKLFNLNNERHILYLNFHHIIADAISINIFLQELSSFYNSTLNNQQVKIPNLPMQYSDYCLSQYHKHNKASQTNQLSFWQEQLQNKPTCTILPYDYLNHSPDRKLIKKLKITLPKQQINLLRKVANRHHTTLFTIFLASLYILLRKYSNQKDINIGAPFSARQNANFSNLIGCFIKSTILRINYQDEENISQIITMINNNILKIYDNLDTSLAEITKIYTHNETTSTNLFKIFFAYQNFAKPTIKLSDIRKVKIEQLDANWSEFDLSFIVNIFDENKLEDAELIIEYATNLYNSTTIEKIANNFLNVISLIPDHLATKVKDFCFLDSRERHQLMLSFNNSSKTYPANNTIHDLFSAQARKNPNKVAIETLTSSITYAELDKKSNDLANYLISIQKATEEVVAIFMDRSIEMIIAIFAILKSGNAYLNLNPQYTINNLKNILNETKAKIVITNNLYENNITQITSAATAIINLDNINKNSLHTNLVVEKTLCTPNNLAYVIYTSGSTGAQKGVMIEHISLVNNLYTAIENYQITEHDKMLQSSSASFDIFAEELYPTLMAGATITLIEKDDLLDKERFFYFLQRTKTTIINLSTAFWANIAKYTLPDNIRLCILGGDKLERAQYNLWRKNNSSKLVNTYGPTETTIISTLYHCTEKYYNNNIPIGKPVANTQIYILDKNLKLLPIGVIGEIYISGIGLARGYLNQPELTKERFISHPFISGQKIYKTGDYGKFLADGNIEFIERKDTQVKISGYRIDLANINNVLMKNPKIYNSVTIIKQDKLVNFYVAHSKISEQILINFLRLDLPEYMVPKSFIHLNKIPLTINGKIDFKSLANIKYKIKSLKNIEPRNEKDKILIKIWQEVLTYKPINIKDNYFNLGGSSLKSMQIIDKLRQKGFNANLKNIFCYPTIEELSDYITPIVPLQQKTQIIAKNYPLTPAQLWFFHEQGKIINQWNQSILLELKQNITPQLLQKALKNITKKHLNFALRYSYKEDNFIQSIDNSEPNFKFASFDLGKTAIIDKYFKEQMLKLEQALDLTSGPVVAFGYFKSDQKKYLFITMHHLVTDGVSWQIFFNDLNHFLDSKNKACLSSNNHYSYDTYLKKLYDYTKSSAFKAEYKYWRKLYQKSLTITNCTAKSAKVRTSEANYMILTASSNVTNNILDSAIKYNAELNHVLIANLFHTYHNFFKQSNLQIDIEGHGRDIFANDNITKIMGWFSNIYPVIFTNYTQDNHKLVKYVKTNLAKVPNKGIGFALYKYLKKDQNLSSFPRSKILFNFLGELKIASPYFKFEQFNFENFYDQNSLLSYDLEIHIVILEKKLKFYYKYNQNIYSSKMIKDFSSQYLNFLKKY